MYYKLDDPAKEENSTRFFTVPIFSLKTQKPLFF